MFSLHACFDSSIVMICENPFLVSVPLWVCDPFARCPHADSLGAFVDGTGSLVGAWIGDPSGFKVAILYATHTLKGPDARRPLFSSQSLRYPQMNRAGRPYPARSGYGGTGDSSGERVSFLASHQKTTETRHIPHRIARLASRTTRCT